MAGDASTRPTFSRLRKWGIGLNLLVRTAAVLALVVMVNYLAALWFDRLYFSAQTRLELSPRTVSLLQSVTNDVNITLYYDKDDPVFTTITELLNEYQAVNPHLRVRAVDYVRDAGEAEKVKGEYRSWFGAAGNKNLVIFNCNNHVQIVPGDALMNYTLERLPEPVDGKLAYDRKPVAFKGEVAFDAMLLQVTSPTPWVAYYLHGHDERQFEAKDQEGFLTVKQILEQDDIRVEPLSLLGTNAVPMDCGFLIVAGPVSRLDPGEAEKIDQYLRQGGRLFALLDFRSLERPTGLESVLWGWGVDVHAAVVQDPERTTGGNDLIVEDFSQHPVVNPLQGSRLRLVLPRVVGKLPEANTRSADAPKVEEIAFSGPHARLASDPQHKPGRFPLAVAVEKGAVPGVVTERGTTRIVVAGDSLFLGNACIDFDDNRWFVGYVANWLLYRPALLHGPGPRPVTEYRLTLTRAERRAVQGLLLAGMPGVVLLFGGLVWLRRRT